VVAASPAKEATVSPSAAGVDAPATVAGPSTFTAGPRVSTTPAQIAASSDVTEMRLGVRRGRRTRVAGLPGTTRRRSAFGMAFLLGP
jgi:hypothetical protein